MSAIQPPPARVWWKQPIDRLEGTWIVLALIWCLVMFFMMPYWHFKGKQNSTGEGYRVTPMDFVVHALTTFFYLSNPKAAEIMMTAHFSGMAYVQTLPKSEAEKRINKAHFAAGLEGYPLHFSMESE